MTLASVLLQPNRFTRVAVDSQTALIEDVTRVLTLLLEDAAQEGPFADALVAAAEGIGPRLQAQLEARFGSVRDRLRFRVEAFEAWLKDLGRAAEAVADKPGGAVELARRLLNDLTALVDLLSLNGLRRAAQELIDILVTELGWNGEFVVAQLRAFLQDAITRFRQIPTNGDAVRSRQQRTCVNTFRRLDRFVSDFSFPTLRADDLARPVYAALNDAGITNVLAQAGCALEELGKSVASAQALGQAVPITPAPSGAMRALLPRSPGTSLYSWYASWLLSDEDLPLFSPSDLIDAAQIVESVLDGADRHFECLRIQFTAAQLEQLRSNRSNPDDETRLMLVAVFNQLIQGPLIYDSERFPEFDATPELKDLHLKAIEDQNVLLANRRFFEEVFQGDVKVAHGKFRRWLGRTTLCLLDWPRNEVYVRGDGKFVMCGDMPLMVGENLIWQAAPIFAKTERGQYFWLFEHFRPDTCEAVAYHLAWPGTLGKAIWHLVNVILDQPGHRVGGSVNVGLEFAESLNQLLFGKPVSGYEKIGCFGRWLASGVIGPRPLAIFFGSFQGKHTQATGGNKFLFWLTVFLGDVIRTTRPSCILNTIRDVVLSFMTLLNFGGPRDGPSTLPPSPAQNHLKQGPIASLMNKLFIKWLVSYYQREDYSIEIFSAGNIGDRRSRAFKLWLAGGIAMGALTGLTTTLVAQITAWAEDWARFGRTVGCAMLHHVLAFWFYVYFQKEGDTEDGTFTTGGLAFKGYPNKDSSPYRLPWAAGDSLFAGQANQGLWSHNDITANARQLYAVDFGHDHQQPIRACRGGVVWSFVEGNADTSTAANNNIVILHTATDSEHDNPRGSGNVTTFARYLHGAQNGVTNAFASRGLPPPVQESTNPGLGTVVNQGDIILLADDTGISFHSHLHLDVVMDQSGGVRVPGGTPAPNPGGVGIPFVFREVRGTGRPINLTWYESENG